MTILDLQHRQRWASAPGRALRALPSAPPLALGRAARRRAHTAADSTSPARWEPTSEQRLRHDLRQSLGLLMALADGVQQNLGQAREVLRHLDQMRQETERMGQLVRAHAEDGNEPQHVDVGQLVSDSWRSAVAAAPCDMRLVCDAGTHAVLDPVALTRSVQNLLDNAVRAAGAAGAVVVEVRDLGDTVTVTVSDTGPGFGNVPTQQGLGLITVRRFVAECGGTLEVTGTAHGGAELVLRLPAAARAGKELTCAS